MFACLCSRVVSKNVMLSIQRKGLRVKENQFCLKYIHKHLQTLFYSDISALDMVGIWINPESTGNIKRQDLHIKQARK